MKRILVVFISFIWLAVSAKAATIYSQSSSTVFRYDAVTGQPFNNYNVAGGGSSLTFGDGVIYSQDSSDTVSRYDAATGAFINSYGVVGAGGSLTFGDGVIYSQNSSTVFRYDAGSGQPLNNYSVVGAGSSLTSDPRPVPLPSSFVLLCPGIGLLGWTRRR